MRAYFDTPTQLPSREDCQWAAREYRRLLREEGRAERGPMTITCDAGGVKLNAWAAEALLRHVC